jgi:hypothetical protein
MSQPGDPTASPRKLKGMSTVIEYHQGCFFGEQAFLGLADSRSVSIRAKTYVILCQSSTHTAVRQNGLSSPRTSLFVHVHVDVAMTCHVYMY